MLPWGEDAANIQQRGLDEVLDCTPSDMLFFGLADHHRIGSIRTNWLSSVWMVNSKNQIYR